MNIRQRIRAVMLELEGIQLVKTKGLGFKIIQHDDVTEALRPLYLKHGIDQEVSVMESRQLEGGTTELLVEVQWVNVDEPADIKRVVSIGHSTSNQKSDGMMRRDDLGVGKALSYAVKMAQLKNFALLSGDEDLEQQQSKPERPAQMASTALVEDILNCLSACSTKEAFKEHAERAAAISDQLTPAQKQIMGAAWKAAKDRSEGKNGNQPLPESLGGEPRPAAATDEKMTKEEAQGLTGGEMAELMSGYGNVRTETQLSDMRKRAGALYSRMTHAQKSLGKELDTKAQNLLQMQREAAQ